MSSKNQPPQTLKGFRDFLPKEARQRQWLRAQMIKVFERWGYEPIETPTLEPLEIFTGAIGEDEKLFFQFKDRGGRDVALRYDQTVPTCRFVGQNFAKLKFPFKRYQIQPAFRAENPQKGRYREFIQADIDIFGVASPLADAECIAVSIDLYKSLRFPRPIVLINNRDLLADIPYPVIAAIDKLKKIGREGVVAEIANKGFTSTQADEFLKKVESLQPDDKLRTIFQYLDDMDMADNYKFEPTLARSFAYSQGPIWEITIEGYSTASFAGSVGGGERYDDLVEKITGRRIPATGIAFGFDRTLEAMEEFNLLPKDLNTTQVLVTVFSPDLYSPALQLSRSLRSAGISTELYPDPAVKLDKQLKYAEAKGIPYVAIIGPEEVRQSRITLKNLSTSSQKTCTLAECLRELKLTSS